MFRGQQGIGGIRDIGGSHVCQGAFGLLGAVRVH